MRFDVITLFPKFIQDSFSYGVTGRALEDKKIVLKTWNPREFSNDQTQRVDDRPYGGGPGMVMKAGPVYRTIKEAKKRSRTPYVVYMCPKGSLFKQIKAEEFASKKHLILIAGRYEGIDQRVIDKVVDEECSIGDFVVSGGEIPALIVMDAVTRLLTGVLGDPESASQDSFSDGLLEYPHFTRPKSGILGDVPEVLLKGNHEDIYLWRLKQSLLKTLSVRPDLLDEKKLTHQEKMLLEQIISEDNS